MHRKSLLVLAAMTASLLVVPIAQAQPGVPGLSFGVKAGLNFTDLAKLETINTLAEIETEAKTSFVGGAYLNLPFGPLKLQIEGLYSVRGAKGYSWSGPTSNKLAWEFRTDYLEIPVLLRFDLPTPVLTPYVFAGVSYGILLKAEQRDHISNDKWVDIKDMMKPTDWSLTFGAGAKLFGLIVEGRYSRGLSDNVEDPLANAVVTEASNELYSVLVGLELF